MELSGDLTYFLLILARMSGCVFFNQIFGRGNLPMSLRMGISLFLTITVYGMLPPQGDMVVGSIIEYAVLIAKELFLGYLIGYIISLFFSTVVISGEILDMQVGMSMSKIYDPHSNLSMGISGSFLNTILILVFFGADGHLTLIHIILAGLLLIMVLVPVFATFIDKTITLMFDTMRSSLSMLVT